MSPGSAPVVINVGASTKDDTVARLSNTGECVSLYAPGEGPQGQGGRCGLPCHLLNVELALQCSAGDAQPQVMAVVQLYVVMWEEFHLPLCLLLQASSSTALHGQVTDQK